MNVRLPQTFSAGVLVIIVSHICVAQHVSSEASSHVSTASDDATGRQLLAAVRDNVFSFDDPAFYWYCKKLRDEKDEEKYRDATTDFPLAWKMLMERPSDYRGELVTIEGRLETKSSYTVPNRSGVGELHQCELSNTASNGICTVVAVESPATIPPGAIVRAKGFFLKVRSFRTAGGDLSAGPLIVAPRLHLISRDLTGSTWSRGFGPLGTWAIVGLVILLAGWFALRRGLQRNRQTTPFTAPPRKIAGTAEDFAWLASESEAHIGPKRSE